MDDNEYNVVHLIVRFRTCSINIKLNIYFLKQIEIMKINTNIYIFFIIQHSSFIIPKTGT